MSLSLGPVLVQQLLGHASAIVAGKAARVFSAQTSMAQVIVYHPAMNDIPPTAPPDLDLPLALWFYDEFIRKPHEQKRHLRQQFGFSEGRPGSSEDWELFAAILLKSGRNVGSRYGHDLLAAEVKSARVGSSFEYQYHLNTGVTKLDAEHTIDHVFVSYDDAGVTVRLMPGQALRPLFESWREPLLSNYDPGNLNRRQRFRKNVPYGVVVRQGRVLVQIQEGRLTLPQEPTPQERAQARERGQAMLAPPELPPAM